MSSQLSNKALAEDGGFAQKRKDGSIIANFGQGVEHTSQLRLPKI